MIKRFFLLLLICPVLINAQNLLKVSGQKIVDQNQNEVLLRGIGLGGWLLQEGYMLHTSSFANAEHQLKAKITELIGQERCNQFYQEYHNNYVVEKDIKKIAEWGFNSIRIPMHYRRLMEDGIPAKFKEEGFQEIDKLLQWCKNYELYLILDLHAAPGGQSDEGISDYDSSKPSLWESETNKEMTIELWRELAKRYKNEEWIAGYDLINEPKWELGNDNEILRDLYIKITEAVRSEDSSHIIFIEGNWYATAFNGLTPAWDDNMVYSFHKYWNSNDKGAIQYLLDLRKNTNRPLWLGESGENSNVWFTECIELLENNNIGWSWWPHKKIASIAGPLSAELTKDYQSLLDYWNDPFQHLRPDENFAYNTLMEQARKLHIDSCKYQPDVIYSMFTKSSEQSRIPYLVNKVPGTVYATNYDIGHLGVSYNDKGVWNKKGAGGETWNNGWQYRNDGVDIEKCSDQKTNGYNVGWIESGEWIRYTINVEESGKYNIKLRVASEKSDGQLIFRIEEQSIQQVVSVPYTGGWQSWATINLQDMDLIKGKATLFIQILTGDFNLNYFELEKKTVTNILGTDETPDQLELNQNYPNPFNNGTYIDFTLPNRSSVKLKVFNTNGEYVDCLVDDEMMPGKYRVKWETTDVASGVYFYTLQTENNKITKKAILMK